MGEAEAPKRRGRPRKSPAAPGGRNVTIRMYGDLHHQIEVASRRSGRSVSAEISFMLERAFAEAVILDAVRDEIRKARLTEVADILSEQPEPYINQSAPPH